MGKNSRARAERRVRSVDPREAEARGHREQWLASLDLLDEIVNSDPEPGSAVDQFVNTGALPDFVATTRVTVNQATEFLRAALRMAPLKAADEGPGLAPIGPLARASLLALSKVVSVCAPLGMQGGIGPALQQHHDALIETILEQDRLALFEPHFASTKAWHAKGRGAFLTRLNSVRSAIGLSDVAVPKGPVPRNMVVKDVSWILEAQKRTDQIQEWEQAPRGEAPYRMRWAWHRGSVVAHGGFAGIATADGLMYTYLNPAEASALLRHAVELACVAQRTVDFCWLADAERPPIQFNSNYRVPATADENEAAGPLPDIVYLGTEEHATSN